MSNTSSQEKAPKKRSTPARFFGEVRSELKRVVWPSRTEVLQYSAVVTVVCIIIALMVFGLDALFGQLALWIFG